MVGRPLAYSYATHHLGGQPLRGVGDCKGDVAAEAGAAEVVHADQFGEELGGERVELLGDDVEVWAAGRGLVRMGSPIGEQRAFNDDAVSRTIRGSAGTEDLSCTRHSGHWGVWSQPVRRSRPDTSSRT